MSRYIFGASNGHTETGWNIDADSDAEAIEEAKRLYVQKGANRGELFKVDGEWDTGVEVVTIGPDEYLTLAGPANGGPR